ncbi:lipopolysaccharide biosynthesis protein [Streptomyces sp. NPDC020983]|uniref:lipopolysaccharide biosynthesis protein n=1 Tax=Streptomyces sp. NPDC020983 TaxID=3365106 RepID=UPI00379728D6
MRALPRAARWAALPLGIGCGMLAGLGWGVAATPQYAATSYVMVVSQHADAPAALGFAQAYGRVVTGTAVLAGAQAAAGTSAERLRGHVASQTSPDAPMISVTGTASTGAAAARYANAVAASLAAAGNRDTSGTGVRLLLFAPASAPGAPSSPSAALSAAVGGSAGGLLGALALLVRPAARRAQDTADPAAAVPAPSVREPA